MKEATDVEGTKEALEAEHLRAKTAVRVAALTAIGRVLAVLIERLFR